MDKGRFGDVYKGFMTLKGNIKHPVNLIHSEDLPTMLAEAKIMAKVIGADDDPDETEHHENVRNLFGLAFNQPPIKEVQKRFYIYSISFKISAFTLDIPGHGTVFQW